MKVFKESTLSATVDDIFGEDTEANNNFFSMIVCCEVETHPPTITINEFKKIIKTIGPTFRYITRTAEQKGHIGTVMMICYCPYQNNNNLGRIYMLPLDQLKLYRSVTLGGDLQCMESRGI